MSSSHHQQRTTVSKGHTHYHPQSRPRTAPGSVSTLRPPHERNSRSLMPASTRSLSNTDQEEQDPFEYLGCSNCTDDFSNHPHSFSFWLIECGHLACAPCLGYPDGGVDPTQHYQCPIPSCGGFRSAVYELNPRKRIDGVIREFFESPHSIAERMDSVLSFQNQHMRLRIKNLHNLVHVQRQALRQNQASADQELPILKQQVQNLKRQLRDLNLQFQQLYSRANLPDLDHDHVPVKRRTTLDQDPEPRRAHGITNRGLRTSSLHQAPLLVERNLPQARSTNRPRTAASITSNPTVAVPQASSRRAQPPVASSSRRQRTIEEPQEASRFPREDGPAYDHRLGAIPEDDTPPVHHEPRSRAGAGNERAPAAARPDSHARKPAHHPPSARNPYGGAVRPMPMPTPSRVAPMPTRTGQSVRRHDAYDQAGAAAYPVNVPTPRASRADTTETASKRFVFHPGSDRPNNARPARAPLPFFKSPPLQARERVTPSKRSNPFVNSFAAPPRF
ncbi:hypothetical protein PCANC_05203 [Puccinia coronata f. sp. avenae]|uniref:RING-type domain-containing protein n=1 Tax=Puccinia coronata f. sp. avenae TaxID=200324 RepID=A0A2N5VW83_9BASI|nr:hypothetical protein PCANC_05203 [Puccinia coronata f. sp. avenae]